MVGVAGVAPATGSAIGVVDRAVTGGTAASRAQVTPAARVAGAGTGVAPPGPGGRTHTSSMRAIGALSPRRLPSLRIRV